MDEASESATLDDNDEFEWSLTLLARDEAMRDRVKGEREVVTTSALGRGDAVAGALSVLSCNWTGGPCLEAFVKTPLAAWFAGDINHRVFGYVLLATSATKAGRMPNSSRVLYRLSTFLFDKCIHGLVAPLTNASRSGGIILKTILAQVLSILRRRGINCLVGKESH